VLPAELYDMPKRGFPTPLAAWLRGPLAGWLRDRLCGPQSRLSRIFKPDYPARAVEAYLHSWRRHVRPLDEIATHRIWMLLCLESWLRQTEELYGVSMRLDL
jgi:asparagine synthase (glutamine-hydrolysing)